jgi:acetyl-CoA carboxylase biotin carboxylase subunit
LNKDSANTTHRINKVLVANRGEIAVRIMRTCRQMGIFTVAVYSDADTSERFVKEADEAIRIGGNNPSESYLDQDKIFHAARLCRADAIHPGYGFLSENATFASRCQEEGFIFIGPNSAAIEQMGSKIRAKAIMDKAGVPVIPGYNGEKQDAATLKEEAVKIGFPVLLKASAGGGGKGMRVVRSEEELDKAISAAKREATNAFGDDDLLIEKYFESSRHIEIQVFGDKHGNYIHLGERECTIQRRHQKIIEESPSPVLTPAIREAMGQAAVRAAEAIRYDNAGTVEFIYSGEGEFYFLEVNTRLQVEHPVTEMVTGLDLVEMQIEIASGKPICISQNEVAYNGHAIECRLYAEDPSNDFLPATGKVTYWNKPDVNGLRFDSGISQGSNVSIFYDPMIAKVIAHGRDRDEALSRMHYSLSHLGIAGPVNNRNFLLQVIEHEDFKAGEFDTHFLEHPFVYDPDQFIASKEKLVCAALAREYAVRRSGRTMLAELPSGWRNNFYQPQRMAYTEKGSNNTTFDIRYRVDKVAVHVEFRNNGTSDDGSSYKLSGIEYSAGSLQVEINGIHRTFSVIPYGDQIHVHAAALGNITLQRVPRFEEASVDSEPGGYNAPMPGQVLEVMVETGQQVKKGDTLLILLSMKMENAVEALEDGEVEEVFVKKDMFVEADSPLIKIKV